MHIPVLLEEVLRAFDPKPGEYFIDCTAGEGGHALAIVRLVVPLGGVLAIDRDPRATVALVAHVEQQGLAQSLTVVQENFKDLMVVVEKLRYPPPAGILFDLGFSSNQIAGSGRGFSFQQDEALDMRFNPNETQTATAADIVNGSSKEELMRILYEFGQERRAPHIAEAIIQHRKHQKIKTTQDLVDIILSVVQRYGRTHPATKTFQALRIATNHELENIQQGLDAALGVVSLHGKIVVISFHSLEDKIVKDTFRRWERDGRGARVNKKVIVPTREEIKNNPRSRSAKLRIFQRIANSE